MDGTVTLRCDVGIFTLWPVGGIYKGEANGIRIEADDRSVTVSHGTETRLFFLRKPLEQSVGELEREIDDTFQHLLDNDDGDVRYLETSNGRVAYYQYNTHLKGDPVIFLHGGPGGDSNTSRARRIRLDRPVFLYDQMGCGRSDPIKDLSKWDHDSYVSELKEVVELMGFRRFSIVGGSWGAGLAAAYAIATHCERIESMVLVSPFFSTRIWEQDAQENLRLLGPELHGKMQRCIEGRGTRRDYVEVMEAYDSRFLFSQECNREIAIAAANEEPSELFKALVGENEMHTTGTMKSFDIVDDLGKIDVPVLILNGDSDEVRIPTAEMYRDRIKGSELKIIRGAGHALSSEQFDAYAEEIRGFIRKSKESLGQVDIHPDA